LAISPNDDTGSTTSDGEYDSELDPNVDMPMEDDVDTPDSIDLDWVVDMERQVDNEEEEDEEEEDGKEEKEVDEDEKEDKDEDDGKEPQMVGQGKMLNTSTDDVDTTVDNQPIVLPEQGQEIPEHIPRPQPLAPGPRPQTVEPCPQPQTLETHPLCGLEHVWLVTLQNHLLAVPTVREAEAARNTSEVHVDQQMLSKSATGDRLPHVSLPDAPLAEERLQGSVGKE